ncbi:MAG: hypothetical protein IPG17_33365 [Sandaracinaceae bacterium]|nr:hypothetical protein [Sandaracinaceae bacterium]
MSAAREASLARYTPLLVLLAVPALHLLTACGNTGTVIQPRTFDRPERVAFACYDRGQHQLRPARQLRCRRARPRQ